MNSKHMLADFNYDWPTAEVRTLLAKFGLVADHVLRPAETLSPGERTRAALALLQARGVPVIVLTASGRAKMEGAAVVMAKPLQPDRLCEAIRLCAA